MSAQANRINTTVGHYDSALLLAAGLLAAMGVIMVASSSMAIAEGQHTGPFYYLTRHLIFLGMGIGCAVAVTRLELEFLEQHAFLLLLAGIILLLLVFVPGVGMRVNGARRWIHLGIAGFQCVEAVKLLFIVYISSYLVRHSDQVQDKLLGVIKPLGIAGLLVLMLLAQPDFGSATLILATAVGMIWLGGAKLRNLVYLAIPVMPALAWAALTQDYRVKRLTSFLDPWGTPFTDGYQLTQALIAIGRGEWFGVGLGNSVQKLYYLPEANTDFILSVIAEELGIMGILLVFLLFSALVGRAFFIGMKGIEKGLPFAGYCAFGIGLWLGLQALVSIGVNLGALPTKGLTLPLISSGGSSVLMTCVAVGLLLRTSYEVNREDYRSRSLKAGENP